MKWFNLGIVVMGVLLIILAYIKQQTTELAVTNRRVLAKFGIISRTTFELFLNKVESVNIDQPIMGRLLGFGSIHVKGTGGGHVADRRDLLPGIFPARADGADPLRHDKDEQNNGGGRLGGNESVNQNYISQTLKPGESIITNARLHWIGYISGMMLPLLGWLATFYVPAIAAQPWAKWVCLCSLAPKPRRCCSWHISSRRRLKFIITDDNRLIGSYGHALERTSFELPLKDIHGINVSQSLLGRICGYGTVSVEHNGDPRHQHRRYRRPAASSSKS